MRTDSESMRLQTERLLLIPCGSVHVDDLHALWTDADVRRFLWDDEVISRDTAAEVVRAGEASFREHGFGIWGLFPREPMPQESDSDGGTNLVGFVGLRHFGTDGEVELLYGLRPDQWGRGLATEASRAVLDHTFSNLGLATIFAGTDPPNVASLRVMDRLGFGHEHRRTVGGLEAIYRSLERGDAPDQ